MRMQMHRNTHLEVVALVDRHGGVEDVAHDHKDGGGVVHLELVQAKDARQERVAVLQHVLEVVGQDPLQGAALGLRDRLDQEPVVARKVEKAPCARPPRQRFRASLVVSKRPHGGHRTGGWARTKRRTAFAFGHELGEAGEVAHEEAAENLLDS